MQSWWRGEHAAQRLQLHWGWKLGAAASAAAVGVLAHPLAQVGLNNEDGEIIGHLILI